MVEIIVDGKKIKATVGNYLLRELKKNGIKIPALCDHLSVEPWGGCRLCLVKITKEEWKGWGKIVASCLFPVEEGLIVFTKDKEVENARREVLNLMLARSPQTPLICELAKEYGLEKTTYEEYEKPTDCILCGLCTRICDELGMSAISLVNRGIGREVAPPFNLEPPDCIGCLSCAYICPTNFIKFEETKDKRKIWGKEFELLLCKNCGKGTVTKAEANYFSKRQGIDSSVFELCDKCKREYYSKKFEELQKGRE